MVYTENGIHRYLDCVSPPGAGAAGVRGIRLIPGGRLNASSRMRVCTYAAARMHSRGARNTMRLANSIEAGK
eukprot:1621096-Pyramimonas_sp.AAC.1